MTDPSRTPPKVVGLGAPISVWVYLEVSEIPALREALADEIDRHRGSSQLNGRSGHSDAGTRCNHLRELRKMLNDVERAAATRSHGRFDVLWPTALVRNVVRAAVAHAERKAAAVGSDEVARHAVAAARQTLRDFEAVDNGGLINVWL